MALELNQWYPGNVSFLPGRSDFEGSMYERPPFLKFTHPLPYGAILHDDGVQFVVFSRSATGMRVLLYDHVDDREPTELIEFDPIQNRWGDVWSVFVRGMGAGQLYHLQADGPYDPARGHRFDSKARLIDPYAKALAGDFLPADDGIIRPPKCVVVDDEFDWRGDRHLRRELSETVIYEIHVRGFTRSATSGVKHPGTYLGVIEKIPYLKSLGVTAVELMPVHEFPIRDCLGHKPKRPNYWGYDPMAFFAPHRGYAVGDELAAQVREFKTMVRELHAAGIEVILDVVFNHTAEGNHQGPTLSFKGLENRVYYMLEDDRRYYRNYSGCGNTLNGNHPVVREMIFHCLRHWVHNYHIDGFRFDLASILSRDQAGNILPNPPVVETIAEDPLLADTKIIAEAWDAAGAYQVGAFANSRWAEWNGRYRDDVRRFWRGDPHMIGTFATRLAGSSDLYQSSGRHPYHSINFVTCHDGFTLNDLVSYNEKHNHANGEHNRDGENNNYSYNYGVEGPTRRKNVEQVRQRQIKNMLATLLLSQGVPMILFGDECRRTQRGNNNAYCQDNPVSWFNWRLVIKHDGLRRFVEALISFRRNEPTVRQEQFLTGQPAEPGRLPDVSWYAAGGQPIDWTADERSLTCLLAAVPRARRYDPPTHHVLLMCHAGVEPQRFVIPEIARGLPWRQFIDTAAPVPDDIYPNLNGPEPPADWTVTLESRSLVCYVAPDA
ncbi:MAG TPA: glycogen debranching protein GlgX [Planctomycetaceae bacterium]|nr:glycogen debranching protein GlgX [Planctomycetaceae bacterium]HIQ20066.1 glycogen debranching enzyme GlgX [Planctomycetota bacterium]